MAGLPLDEAKLTAPLTELHRGKGGFMAAWKAWGSARASTPPWQT
ncbi:MAG: hypothetical protein WDN06_08600 [Asticcacaulis sp.]